MASITSIKIEDGTKLWLDVIQPTPAELADLAARHSLHPAFVKDCLDPNHLPKCEQAGGTRFAIVRALDERREEDAETVQGLTRKIAIFIGSAGVITIHRVDQPFVQKLREEWTDEGTKRTQKHLVNHLLSEVIRSYQPLVQNVSDQLDQLEENVFRRTRNPQFLDEAYHFKRITTVVQQVVRMTEEVLPALTREGVSIESENPFARDLIDQIRRLIFTLDDLQRRIDQILQLHLALETQKNNDIVRVLTLFSAFFLPLTFIAGIYGMNFRHMPELEWFFGYPLIIVLMIVVAVSIGLWFKKKGWIGKQYKT